MPKDRSLPTCSRPSEIPIRTPARIRPSACDCLLRIREAAARAGSGTVLLFCDEAQRYNENEYEWLRDVHDALDRQQIKPFHLPRRSAGVARAENQFCRLLARHRSLRA